MRKNTLNFLVDAGTYILVLAMAATGLLLRYVLPPGSRGGGGLELWGLDRHAWGDVHFWLAVTIGALVVVHVALHWRWVCTTVSAWGARRGGARPGGSTRALWAYGGGFLVLTAGLVGGALFAAAGAVQAGENEHRERGRGGAAAVEVAHVRGSTTAAEAAAGLRVSVAELADRLNLTERPAPDERLGAWARRCGVEMSELRARFEAIAGNPAERVP